ncbi:MAG: PEP-utilizing enzyme, partial [Patescibacteria group bacterium]
MAALSHPSIDLGAIKNVDWQYLVSRAESLLFKSVTQHCYRHFQKVTGIPWTANYYVHFGPGDVFHSARELATLRQTFAEGGIKLFKDFRRRLLKYANAFDHIAEKIGQTQVSSLEQKTLKQLTEDYFQAALYAHNFMLPFPAVDNLISQKILELLPPTSDKERQQWLATLTYPTKQNSYTKEELFLHRLAQKQTQGKDITTNVREHTSRFGWIGARGYWFNRAWSEVTIRDRLENIRAQGIDPGAAIAHLKELRKERKEVAQKFMKKFRISSTSELYKLTLLAREFAYLRTWRTDTFYRAGFKAKNLFFEIARRANFSQDDVSYLTFLELIQAAQGQKLPSEELSKRKQSVTTVLFENQYYTLAGKQWEQKLQGLIGKQVTPTKEIKGTIAYPGKITGLAKLVFTAQDIPKVQRGDILIAVMTFPHLVPAMEKAAAFVTDEGGILSHAAIVSREMKRPCIIATKIA